jgi:hypothetical protein
LQYNNSEAHVPRKKIDFNTVRIMARDLAGVEESTAYRSPALKVRGKLMAVIPVHKSAEPDSLAVSVDFERRAELLETAPDTYYLTDHYVNYPVVLVRLSRIHTDALRDLLGLAWRFATNAGRRPAKSPARKIIGS